MNRFVCVLADVLNNSFITERKEGLKSRRDRPLSVSDGWDGMTRQSPGSRTLKHRWAIYFPEDHTDLESA